MKTMTTAAIVALLLLGSFLTSRAVAALQPAAVTIRSGLDMTRATIPVEIDGRRDTCVLDTGTSTMVVSQSVATAARLPVGASVEEIAPDGAWYADRRTHLDRFAVGDYVMRGLPALISSRLSAGVLCGYDFFAKTPTLIDRDRRFVTLFPALATLDRMQCLPVDLTPHVPLATVDIDGERVDDVVLDSGMTGGSALWSGIAQRLPQPAGDRADPPAFNDGFVCGQTATIGFFSGVPPDPITVCSSAQHPDGYNGIVETNLPNIHQIAVDYPKHRVCFNGGADTALTSSPALGRGAWARYNRLRPPR